MEKTKHFHYAWVMLIACCFISFSSGLFSNTSGVFLRPVSEALGVGMGQVSLYGTVRALCNGFATPFAGKIYKKYKERTVLACAYLVLVIGVALSGTVQSLWQFILLGCICGMANAFTFTLPVSLLLNNWFIKNNGFAIGIAMAISSFSGMVFNPILGAFVTSVGVRYTYLILAGIIAVFIFPVTLFVIKSAPAEKGLTPYGYDEIQQEKKDDELVVETGVSLSTAMKSPAFYMLFVAFGLTGIVSAFVAQLNNFGQSVGLSAAVAGTLASAALAGSVVGRPTLGAIRDKWGATGVVIAGGGMACLGFIILILSGSNPTYAVFMVGAFCIGWVNALTAAGSSLVTLSTFGRKDYAQIFSNLSVGITVIGAFAHTAFGFIYDIFGSYRPAFIVGVCFCAALIVLYLVAISIGKKLKWE